VYEELISVLMYGPAKAAGAAKEAAAAIRIGLIIVSLIKERVESLLP
jgi:hypothetical protein